MEHPLPSRDGLVGSSFFPGWPCCGGQRCGPAGPAGHGPFPGAARLSLWGFPAGTRPAQGLSCCPTEIKPHLSKHCASHPCLKLSQAGLYATLLTIFIHVFSVGVKLGGGYAAHHVLLDAPSHNFRIFLVTISQWISDDPVALATLYIILYIYFERKYV